MTAADRNDACLSAAIYHLAEQIQTLTIRVDSAEDKILRLEQRCERLEYGCERSYRRLGVTARVVELLKQWSEYLTLWLQGVFITYYVYLLLLCVLTSFFVFLIKRTNK